VKISIDTNLIPKEAALNYLLDRVKLNLSDEFSCIYTDKALIFPKNVFAQKAEYKYEDTIFTIRSTSKLGQPDRTVFTIRPDTDVSQNPLLGVFGCNVYYSEDKQNEEEIINKIATALHSLGVKNGTPRTKTEHIF